MRALLVHVWKEWREHRAVLLGIAAAIPLLTAATFVGFASFGSQLAGGAALFTLSAAAMTALALSVELFAGEVSRRTIDFWRRQPGGLAIGWGAKLAMLVVAVAAATVWAGVCFWGACQCFTGSKAADAAWEALRSPPALLLPLAALSLAAWVLLATTWVSRGAAAVGLTFLLLGAIGFPGWVLWGERTAFLATLLPGVLVAVLAGLVLPAGLATLSVFAGRRFGDRPWRAAALCVGVLAVAAGSAYAHASARLERWMDVQIDDPDARVASIFVGAGGRTAYANVSRLGDDTVSRSFSIDLESGRARPIGAPGTSVSPWTRSRSLAPSLSGCSLVVCEPSGVFDATESRMELFDGATAQSLGVSRAAPLEGRALEIVRRHLRETTPVRTLDGRRAWAILQLVPGSGYSADGRRVYAVETWIERERTDGSVERVVFPPSEGLHTALAMPCGWWGFRGDKSVLVPADVKSAADYLPFTLRERPGIVSFGGGRDRIDARRYVYRRPRMTRGDAPSWRVADVVAETDIAAPGLLPEDALVSLHGADALVWNQPRSAPNEAPARGALVSVDLESGERGRAAAFGDGVPTNLRWVTRVGATPAGKTLLFGTSSSTRGYLLFDPAANRLERWTPDDRASANEVALIADDDTLYVTSPRFLVSPSLHVGPAWSMRLERLRLGGGERTSLFPR